MVEPREVEPMKWEKWDNGWTLESWSTSPQMQDNIWMNMNEVEIWVNQMRIKKLAQLPHGNGTMVKPREAAFRKKVENGWDKRRLKLS